MNGHQAPSAELRRLVTGLCDGALGDADVERLEHLLQTDRAALAYYVQYLHIHTSLAWSVSANHIAGDTAPTRGRLSRRVAQRAWQAIRRPTPMSLTVSALVMGLIITAMAVMAPPAYRRWTRPTPPAVPATVAVLTNFSDLQWARSQSALPLGTSLVAGQSLNLAAGWAEVKYSSGATLILEAPVQFTVIDAETGELTLGKITTRVADEQTGFVVKTPTARVVDLGTEFGVAHTAGGESTVHVYEGLVEVSLTSDPSRVHRLRTGEVRRLTKTSIERALPQSAPFLRQHEFTRLASPDVVADARRDFRAADFGASTFHWQHLGLRGRTSGVWNYYRSRTMNPADADAGLQLLEFLPDQDRRFLMYCCPQFTAHVPAVHHQQMFHSAHDGAPKSNELSVHPGDETDYGFVVVRWTAAANSPSRVRVQAAARMLGLAAPKSVTGVDFAVYVDGQQRQETAIAPSDNVGTAFDFQTEVMPGKHLDFVVGPHGDFSNDQVGLSVQISGMPPRAGTEPEQR